MTYQYSICMTIQLIFGVAGQLIIEADPKSLDFTTASAMKQTRLTNVNPPSIPKAISLNVSETIGMPFTRYENVPIGQTVLMTCEAFNRYKFLSQNKNGTKNSSTEINSDIIRPIDNDLEVAWYLPSDHKVEIKEVNWGCGDNHENDKEEDILFSQKLLSSGLTRFCIDNGKPVSENGTTPLSYGLKILRVKEDDSGIYHCAIRRAKTSQWLYGKVALNLSPLRGNVHAKLKQRAITAGWLAGSAGLASLLLLALNKYKYKSGPSGSSSSLPYYGGDGGLAAGHHGRNKKKHGDNINGGGAVAHHHMGGNYQYFQYGSTPGSNNPEKVGSAIGKQPLPTSSSSAASYNNSGYEMAEIDVDRQHDSAIDESEVKM